MKSGVYLCHSYILNSVFHFSHLGSDGSSEEDSTAESVGSESEASQMDTSLYIPTPERYLHHVRELSKKSEAQ